MKTISKCVRRALLAVTLSMIPFASTFAAASIAVMPFDYPSKKIKSAANIVRQGKNGEVWVLKTKEEMVVELETHKFTNKLITSLVKENKFDVVERQKLDRLLDEQKLGTAGLADPARAAQVGKLLGADYFVMAEISVFDGSSRSMFFKSLGRYNIDRKLSIVVDVRVVDTTTGKIVYSEKVDASREFPIKLAKSGSAGRLTRAQVDEVERELCKKIVRGIVDTVFPIKVLKHSNNGVIYLNRGSNGGVKVGNVYKAVEQGEELVDDDTGLVLGAEETPVAIIRVTETQAKFSKAQMVRWISGRPEGLIQKGAICRPFSGELPPAPKPAPPPPPADTTAPSIRFIQPADKSTVTKSDLVAVIEIPDSDVATVTINGQKCAKSGNRYSLSVQLQSGLNTIVALASDNVGNTSTKSIVVTLDDVAPLLNFVSPSAGVVLNTNQVRVVVECTDSDVAQVSINGQNAAREGSQFSVVVTAQEGQNTVQATATDFAGNKGLATTSFGVDTLPPTIVILSPKVGQTLNANPVNVWVQCRDAFSVTINGKAATPRDDDRYKIEMTAREGKNKIVVVARDGAGNEARANASFIYDSTPPDLTASAEVVISGKVDDPKSTVTINGKSVRVNADGSYSTKVKLSGNRKVTIIATDEFGNKKTVVKQF